MVVDDGAEAESAPPAGRHVQDVDPGVALRSMSCVFGYGRGTDKIDWNLRFRNPKNIYPNSPFMYFGCLKSSVADPGCLPRIRLFSIPDPGSASKNLNILTQKMVSKLQEI